MWRSAARTRDQPPGSSFSSAQNPRMLSVVTSCPGIQNGMCDGSTPDYGFASIAIIHSCFTSGVPPTLRLP